jgi:plasmid stabilization system protein ParE
MSRKNAMIWSVGNASSSQVTPYRTKLLTHGLWIMGKRKRVTVPQIVWLPEALEDTQRLRLFFRAGRVLQTGAKRLADFPEIGQPMNDGTDRRELFLPFGTVGYVLRYITDKQTVVIIRTWYSREKR